LIRDAGKEGLIEGQDEDGACHNSA